MPATPGRPRPPDTPQEALALLRSALTLQANRLPPNSHPAPTAQLGVFANKNTAVKIHYYSLATRV